MAREAFADATRRLRSYQPQDPARPPATHYPVPEIASFHHPGPVVGAPSREAPAGEGSIAAASSALGAGRTTSRRLVEQSLAAAERHAALGGVVELDAVAALAQADRLDQELADGHSRGPLHGIPVTVKDVIDVAGLPTRAGSAAYYVLPSTDAVGVARLRAAGAVILAKTSTHEFALGVTTPQSRNPWDPTRIPGGSSGGSAIAVATGIGLGSLGTDTRASIRVPAALSGVVGFKPTYGAIPTDGVVPLSWTMDHVAPMARTVEDAAILLDALTESPGAATRWVGADVEGWRIGVPPDSSEGAEPDVAEAVGNALACLEKLGCVVSEASRPSREDLDATNAVGLVISRCEAATFHRSLGADRSLYWEEVADQLDEATTILAIDYLDAQRQRGEIAADLGAAFGDHDVLAMPTALVLAPPVEDFARYLVLLSRNAIPWSLIGFPAISVPCGRSATGLPVGLQLIAAPHCEHRLVAVGHALERAVGHPLERALG